MRVQNNRGGIIMIFHTFGDREKPAMLLIHGVLCPWQMWDEVIAHYRERYFLIVPELDGHTQDVVTRFHSVEEEAEIIERYLSLCGIGALDTVCGLSMGGRIAAMLWKNGRVRIGNLVIDGGPLVAAGGFVSRMVRNFYVDIVEKCRKRDAKTIENSKRNFLPEKYTEAFLRLVDKMEEDTIVNVCGSVCGGGFPTDLPTDGMRILYLYGTKSNEMLSKKSAKLIRRHYRGVRLVKCKGMMHAELLCFHPQDWLKLVDEFLNQAAG